MTVLGALVAISALQAADTLRLDHLDAATLGAPLPPTWQVRTVADADPAESVVERDEGGGFVLSFTADGAASQFWTELDDPIDPAAGRLTWRWRVEDAVPGAVLTVPERDDAPARLFVVFGDRGLFSSPRTIFYSWGGASPGDSLFTSHVSDRVGVVVVRSLGDPMGSWIEETTDPAKDYQALFGEPPDEPVTAVGFMLDTDQTGFLVRARLAEVAWIRPRKGQSSGETSARTPSPAAAPTVAGSPEPASPSAGPP